MTRVLPEPAPARTKRGPSVCRTASSCLGFRSAKIASGLTSLRSSIDRKSLIHSSLQKDPCQRKTPWRMRGGGLENSDSEGINPSLISLAPRIRHVPLLDGDAFGQVAGLVHVAPLPDRDVVG